MRYEDWLKDNEHIYAEFERIALKGKRLGFKRWSGWAIVNIIRWETSLRQNGDTEFKISNNIIAPLTRTAEQRCAELRGFFTTRKTYCEAA